MLPTEIFYIIPKKVKVKPKKWAVRKNYAHLLPPPPPPESIIIVC